MGQHSRIRPKASTTREVPYQFNLGFGLLFGSFGPLASKRVPTMLQNLPYHNCDICSVTSSLNLCLINASTPGIRKGIGFSRRPTNTGAGPSWTTLGWKLERANKTCVWWGGGGGHQPCEVLARKAG